MLQPKKPNAVDDAYALFKGTGYNKSKEDFVKLLSTNTEAVKDAHKLFVETGYNKSVDDFSKLMGLGKQIEGSSKGLQNTSQNVKPTSSNVGLTDLNSIGKAVEPNQPVQNLEELPAVNIAGTWREDFNGSFNYDIYGYEYYEPTQDVVDSLGGLDTIGKYFEKNYPNTIVIKPPNGDFITAGDFEGFNFKTAQPQDLDEIRKQDKLSKIPFENWSSENKEEYYLDRMIAVNKANGYSAKESADDRVISRATRDKGYDNESNYIYKTINSINTIHNAIGRGGADFVANALGIPEFLFDTSSSTLNGFGLDLPTYRQTFGDSEVLLSGQKYIKDAVKREDLYNKIRYNDAGIWESFNNGNVEDGINKTLDGIGESIPYMVSMMFGNAGVATAFLNSSEGQYIRLQENNIELDQASKILNSTIYGLAEVVPEKIGLNAMLKPYYRLMQKSGTKIAEDALSKTLRKYIGGFTVLTPHAIELSTEYATMLLQNGSAKFTGEDPNRKLTEGIEDVTIQTIAMSGVLSSPAQIANNISEKSIRKKADKLLLQNTNILTAISSGSISEISKKALTEKYLKNVQSVNNYIENQKERKGSLNSKQKETVNNLERQKIISRNILNEPNISDDIKESAQQDIDNINVEINTILETDTPQQSESTNVVEEVVGVPTPVTSETIQSTKDKIKNKGLFLEQLDEEGNRVINTDGSVSESVGELISQSNVAPVPTSVREIGGIEFVEFSNPETSQVDVIVTGTSGNDYVGFYRIYENGKATNKWSSKFNNQSRNKANFKTMIAGVQGMLPKGHQYIEKTSISTDGLRVWGQQLSMGYNLQYNPDGSLVTNTVTINGDAITNELGIEVNAGAFDDISVTDKQSFEKVKKALLPYLTKFGLSESNIRNVNGTVEIDLPILKSTEVVQDTPIVEAVSPVSEIEAPRTLEQVQKDQQTLTAKFQDVLKEQGLFEDAQESKLTQEQINGAVKIAEEQTGLSLEGLKKEAVGVTPKASTKLETAKERLTKASFGGITPRVSGIKKGLVSEELIAQINLDKIGDLDMLQLADQLFKSGEVKPLEIIEEIAGSRVGDKVIEGTPRALQPKEVVGLIGYKTDLDNRYESTLKEYGSKLEAGEDTGKLDKKIAELQDEVYNYNVMSVMTAQQQSLAFRLRQYLLDSNFNLVTFVGQYKKDNENYISPEQLAEFTEMSKKLDVLQAELKDIYAKEQEKVEQEAVSNIVGSVGKETKKPTGEKLVRYTKEKDDAVASLKKAIRVSMGQLNTGGSLNLIGEFTNVVKAYAKLGIVKIEDVTKQAVKDFGKKFIKDNSDALNQAHVDANTKKGQSPEEKAQAEVDREIKKTKNAIIELQKKIDGKVVTPKQTSIWTKEIGELKQKQEQLKKDLKAKRDAEKPIIAPKEQKPYIAKDGSLIIPNEYIREQVRSGVVEIEGLTKAVKDEVSKDLPQITDREVRDAITNYGKEVNQSKDEVAKQINTAKRIGKLYSKLEDLAKGKKEAKTAKDVSRISKKEQELKKQIKVLEKALPKTEQEITFDIKAYEKSLQTQADKLKERIANNELTVEKTTTGKHSPTISKLKQEIKADRETLKKLQDDAGITDANKNTARRNQLSKYVLEKERQISEGDFTVKKPTTYKKGAKTREKEIEAQLIRDKFETAKYVNEQANRGTLKRGYDTFIETVTGLQRGVVAGGDAGSLFLQSMLTFMSQNPAKSIKQITKSFKGARNEKSADESLAELRLDPEYYKAKLSNLGLQEPNQKFGNTDSALQGGVINKIYGIATYPLIIFDKITGKPVYETAKALNIYAAGERFYTVNVNTIRMDLFKEMVAGLEKRGYTIENDLVEFKRAANLVNNFTLRGRLRNFEPVAKELGVALFAPRKVTATFSLINPYYWSNLTYKNKYLAKEGILRMATAMTTLTTMILLGNAVGDDDDENKDIFNPHSPDFMAYKTGNTRIDPFVGMKQNLVFFARFIWGMYKSSSSAETKELGTVNVPTRKELAYKFVESKASPFAGTILKGLGEREGMETDWEEEVSQSSRSMWMSNMTELQKEHPTEMTSLLTVFAIMGLGESTYGGAEFVDQKDPKNKPIIQLFKTKGMSVYTPTRPNVKIYDKITGEKRAVSGDGVFQVNKNNEYETYKKTYDSYFKEAVNNRINELRDLPVSKFENAINKIKGDAKLAGERSVGLGKRDLMLQVKGKNYELTPDQIKQMYSYVEEYKQTGEYTNLKTNYEKQNKTANRKGGEVVNVEELLMDKAVKIAKDKIVLENTDKDKNINIPEK